MPADLIAVRPCQSSPQAPQEVESSSEWPTESLLTTSRQILPCAGWQRTSLMLSEVPQPEEFPCEPRLPHFLYSRMQLTMGMAMKIFQLLQNCLQRGRTHKAWKAGFSAAARFRYSAGSVMQLTPLRWQTLSQI